MPRAVTKSGSRATLDVDLFGVLIDLTCRPNPVRRRPRAAGGAEGASSHPDQAPRPRASGPAPSPEGA